MITFLSLLIAIAISGFALWILSRPELPLRCLLHSALLLGVGIAAMHYTGMSAMLMMLGIHYDPWLFAASVLVAIAAAAALWIGFRLRKNMPHVKLARAGAAVVMGGLLQACITPVWPQPIFRSAVCAWLSAPA